MKNEQEFVKWIIKHCYEKTVATLQKKTMDRKVAEDIVWDAITIIWERYIKTGNLKHQKNLCGLLYIVAFNEWLRQQKGLGGMQELEEKMLKDQQATIAEEMEYDPDSKRARQRRTMKQAFGMLGKRCQELLKRYFGGEKLKDLQVKMGYTSYDSIRASKYQCMKQLKGNINGLWGT